ncbi:MAG: LD-carboxypeptidase [Bacteroidales bacterium]
MVDNSLIIRPKALTQGSLIALIAPAGPIVQEQLDKAQKTLSDLGFRSCFTPDILARKGYLAGDDNIRLNDLHHAFERQDIDAILCIRGGYGAARIVEKVDYKLIKKNPKIFIGYSDITVLLNAINQKTGLVTFHGVLGTSVFNEYTKRIFSAVLTNNTSGELIKTVYPDDISVINPGKASGILAGGNLSIIASLAGTNFRVNFKDKIVFLEDIDEAPYRIDRMLTQLLLTGSLQNASAIVLGNFKGCDLDNQKITAGNSLSLQEVFADRLSNLKIPVVQGYSFGHSENQALFPIGAKAIIDSNVNGLMLCGPAVS